MNRFVRTALLSPFLFLAAALLPGADLYRSNVVGIQGPALDPDNPDRPRYVLEVSYESGTETRVLLDEGVEISRVELVRDGTNTTERVIEDQQLSSETVRDGSGNLVSEALYSAGTLTERSEFVYEQDLLVDRRVYGPDGNLLFVETYAYWRDGTLRSIVKEDRLETRTEFRYRDGRLEEEWISRPGETERFEFDLAGRLVIRERYAEDSLVEQEVRLYWSADADSLLRQVVISAGEEVTTREYDERGRLVQEQVEDGGTVVRQLARTFQDDLLLEETETDPEGSRSWSYSYNDEDERTRTTYREDGEIVEIESSDLPADAAPADRMTELFNRGQPVLRVYYEGRIRLREEVIRDGEVVRTREFSPAGREDE